MIEVDPDDCLVGTMAFQFVNYIYHTHPDVWVFYSNYVKWDWKHGQPSHGISAPIPRNILAQNKYRHWGQYLTSALKTYRT